MKLEEDHHVVRGGKGMGLAFSTTACVGWELERIVAAARRLGFRGIELAGLGGGDGAGMDVGGGLIKSAGSMRQMLGAAGLCVCALATNIVMHEPEGSSWEKAREGLKQAVELAGELGRRWCGCLVIAWDVERAEAW